MSPSQFVVQQFMPGDTARQPKHRAIYGMFFWALFSLASLYACIWHIQQNPGATPAWVLACVGIVVSIMIIQFSNHYERYLLCRNQQ